MNSIEHAFKIVSFRDTLGDEVSFDRCDFVCLVPAECVCKATTKYLEIAKDDFGVFRYDQEPEIGDVVRITITRQTFRNRRS